MSDLMPYQPGRVDRRTARAVREEAARAVMGAARVEAAAYVAFVGLSYARMLSAEEAQLSGDFPHAEWRGRPIVDAYTDVVVGVLRGMRGRLP